MIFSMLFLIVTFKKLDFAENLTNLANTMREQNLDPAGLVGFVFSKSGLCLLLLC